MNIHTNLLYRGTPVDLVVDALKRPDFKYASYDEKRDPLYAEQFSIYFNARTHEIMEDSSGIDIMYAGECHDGFSLKEMRNDGYGAFVDAEITKMKEALYEKLGLTMRDGRSR